MRKMVIEIIKIEIIKAYQNSPEEESSKKQLLLMYSSLDFFINEGPEEELYTRAEKFLGIPNLIQFFTRLFLSNCDEDTDYMDVATKFATAIHLPFLDKESTPCTGIAEQMDGE